MQMLGLPRSTGSLIDPWQGRGLCTPLSTQATIQLSDCFCWYNWGAFEPRRARTMLLPDHRQNQPGAGGLQRYNYLSFLASTGSSGEPRPDPAEPIGFPFTAVPTPTPGPLTAPSLFCVGAVLLPVVAAFF
jgi:hypothetical protein